MALRTHLTTKLRSARRRSASRPLLETLEERLVLSTPDIAVLSATTTDSLSVKVTYSITNGPVTTPFHLDIYRAAVSTFSPSADVKVADQSLSGTDLDTGTHVITVSVPGGLPIDPAHKFVLAVADPQHAVTESDAANDTNDTAFFRTWIVGAVTHGFELQPGTPPWILATAAELKQDGYDDAIAFDWSRFSGLPVPGVTEGAGLLMTGQLLAAINKLPASTNDVVDVHLIGHSRGGVVISQVGLDLQFMEHYGLIPQVQAGYLKMTFLDPHPAHNVHTYGNPNQTYFSASSGPIGQLGTFLYLQFQAAAQDPETVLPINVRDSEVYYQHTEHQNATSPIEKFFNIWGEVPVLGQATHYCDLTGFANGHFEVHDWYLQNVVPTLGTNGPFVCPGSMANPPMLPPGSPIPPNPTSAADLAFERTVLVPAVTAQPRVADSLLRQLGLAEVAISRNQNRLAINRLVALDRFVARQGSRVNLDVARFFRNQLRSLEGNLRGNR